MTVYIYLAFVTHFLKEFVQRTLNFTLAVPSRLDYFLVNHMFFIGHECFGRQKNTGRLTFPIHDVLIIWLHCFALISLLVAYGG